MLKFIGALVVAALIGCGVYFILNHFLGEDEIDAKEETTDNVRPIRPIPPITEKT